jgi:hypothetical protein
VVWPDDVPIPSLPVSTAIKDCFRQAATARLAFIRVYGLPASASPSSSPSQIGPGFDCAKATTPLFRLICSNPQLAKTDLHFYQAYYALWQQLDADGRLDLSADYEEFLNRARSGCGIPAEGSTITGSPSCVAALYNSKRSEWVSRLTGLALEEANRAPEQCLAVQATLQRLSYLPTSVRIDGLYGPTTRLAIVAWQQANNRPPTGFIGDTDAAALLQEPSPPVGAIQPIPPGGPPIQPPAAPTVGDEVQLKERGGVFRVSVRINDAINLDFIIDSGAADVQIPADVVMTLFRTETLTGRDFRGERTYILADGSKLPSAQFVLRELRVGNHRLTDVTASVGAPAGELLLGQSFLSRFKSVTFNYERRAVVITER